MEILLRCSRRLGGENLSMTGTAAYNCSSRSKKYAAKLLLRATPRRFKRFGISQRVRRPRIDPVPQHRVVADGAARNKQHQRHSRLALSSTACQRASAKTRRSAAHRSQRGTNALIIEEILKAMGPSANPRAAARPPLPLHRLLPPWCQRLISLAGFLRTSRHRVGYRIISPTRVDRSLETRARFHRNEL
jgi:hypothetical protein